MPFTWRWSAVAHGGDNDAEPGYFYVPGELVVNAADAVDAEDAAPDLAGVPRRTAASMGALIYTVDGIGEAPAIADAILKVNPNVRVAPHHALRGDPWYEGGPGSHPEPSPDDFAIRGDRAGDGLTIGVLDTGLIDHDALAAGQIADLGPSQDTWDEDSDGIADFESGHGTFVSGLILREAPGAAQNVRRTLSGHGWTSEETLCEDIAMLLATGRLDMLNLSLGGYAYRHDPPVGLENALKALPASVAVVAAAGNFNSDQSFYPAAFGETMPNVLAVGAADVEGPALFKAGYSNFGEWVRVCAIGRQIAPFLTYAAPRDGGGGPPPGAAAPMSLGLAEQPFTQFDGWAEWMGTSFATPQVSAALAVIMSAGAAATGSEAIAVLTSMPLPVVPGIGLLVTRTRLDELLGISM